jgi:hypothetical protein
MAKSKQKKSRNNYDSPWKMVIEKYFQLFVEYYFPKVRDAIDWSVAPEFLDTNCEA